MTTNTKKAQRITRKMASLRLEEIALPGCIAAFQESHRGVYREIPSIRWARHRRRELPTHYSIWSRVTPSPVRLSLSLREMIDRIAADGDPVARAIAGAALDGRRARRGVLPGNFFAAREREGMVSYTPAGRDLTLTDDGRWARSGRQETTPARWSRMILPDHVLARLGGAALSAFAIAFRTREQADKMTVELLDTVDAINQAYDEIDCCSCMRSRPVGGFYRACGAKLATVRQGDSWIARAIVWEDDEGQCYLDRTYAQTEEAAHLLRQHALAAGWRVKVSNSSQLSEWVDAEDRTHAAKLTLDVPEDILDRHFAPYCDTLRWYNAERGTLSQHDREATHSLSLTGGEAEEYRRMTVDGEWIPVDQAVTDVDGEVRDRDDCNLVGNYYYPEDDDRIAWCESTEEYILTEDAVTVRIGRTYYTVHRNCVEGY